MIKKFIHDRKVYWSLDLNEKNKSGLLQFENIQEDKNETAWRSLSSKELNALKFDLLNGLIFLKTGSKIGTMIKPHNQDYKHWSIMIVEKGLRLSFEDALFKPVQTVFIDLDIKTVLEMTQEIYSNLKGIKKREKA